MNKSRMPQQMLFYDFLEEERHRDRPLLRYTDVWKASIKNFSTGHHKVEKLDDVLVMWRRKFTKMCIIF
uniref:Uncharacterized protein n=1 Tax=Arion vulgaris TaxID=1028688 RepID=A0A0B6ZA76_9EUPU